MDQNPLKWLSTVAHLSSSGFQTLPTFLSTLGSICIWLLLWILITRFSNHHWRHDSVPSARCLLSTYTQHLHCPNAFIDGCWEEEPFCNSALQEARSKFPYVSRQFRDHLRHHIIDMVTNTKQCKTWLANMSISK